MTKHDLAGYRVVAVHAHPDDEVLFTGGTLADMTARGAEVTVVNNNGSITLRAPGGEKVELVDDLAHAIRVEVK